MGTCTWHGSPNFRVSCVCMLSSSKEDEQMSDYEGTYLQHSPHSTPSLSVPSPGIYFEGKRLIQCTNHDQLMATCVVSSFINKNLYNSQIMTANV